MAETQDNQEPVSEEKPASEPITPAQPVAVKQKYLVLDLVIGALVLAVLAFLVGNVVVLKLASDYNDRMCRESISLAGEAAYKGQDTLALQRAALHYMDTCAQNGFFIEHPEIKSFEDKISARLRKLTISMATKVRVPAPFLVFDKSMMDPDGQHVTYKSTYIYKLKNPKNCQGSHKLAPNPDATSDDATEESEPSK
ncbi:MAG: hypothetical protein IPP57_09980 [Candidatus Obscuribacter sp.]|jgi:hypothetical protein|nr:hypothetical protein [Candidatus Obscuribacter sp.]MBK9206373.1 hypothetical protein [Candidatus Obscuribacter sp.]MBK9618273.1 hypothetical protein [Candidatus Obscuribacter sp.]MBK9771138.1 hypothetical protein [Candidatus Obscuribacter sp.]MDQ5967202.1 hypothetical protein [Cyanobacteriota bacterium erpe_2018_sw_39hr_WHONDRS-SW48-000098_B_bin.30]